MNSLIPNATRHTHNLLFQRPDLCFISESPAWWGEKKPKKKNQKKKKEGGRKTATRPATETLFSPQLFLYEAGAGECGKEDGFLFRNFPMGRERKCELWKWMHFYSFNTECQLPCNLSKSGGRRKRSEGWKHFNYLALKDPSEWERDRKHLSNASSSESHFCQWSVQMAVGVPLNPNWASIMSLLLTKRQGSPSV